VSAPNDVVIAQRIRRVRGSLVVDVRAVDRPSGFKTVVCRDLKDAFALIRQAWTELVVAEERKKRRVR
jgi:hypothetical protein